MDEIPQEYEEAAMIDGYTRMGAFLKLFYRKQLLVLQPQQFFV